MSGAGPSRRNVLRGMGAVAATVGVGGVAGSVAGSVVGSAPAVGAGERFGLRVVERKESDPRMWFYRFATDAIGWNPGVNVLLPPGYRTSGRKYPVLYLLHPGGTGERDFSYYDRMGIRGLVGGKPIIVVMPDGGKAGWFCDPVSSRSGPRNWETFHLRQLVPWIDARFRTYGGRTGRAVAGYSMGGFGALKYVAKRPDLFDSVSSYSGPASLRRDAGLVVHWANVSAAATDLAGGSIYGMPGWKQAAVSADNPVENAVSFQGRRILLVAGTSPDPGNGIDVLSESNVLAGHREFRVVLDRAGIKYDAREVSGGHEYRPEMLRQDIDAIIAHCRPK